MRLKQPYYNKKELEQLLGYNDQESQIYLPNDIFDELIKNIDIKQKNRSCEHIAFAYCYVYLISYLYRYAVYGKVVLVHLFTEDVLRKILQTSSTYKHKNYITKNGGVLNMLNYIRKQKDFPIRYWYEEWGSEEYGIQVEPEFNMISELREESGDEFPYEYPSNYRINFPVRAFFQDEVLEADNYYSGYYYEFDNTHMIPVEVFIFCMSKADLGTIGFYLYAFLKQKNDHFPNGYDCSKIKLLAQTGLKETKLKETLKALESYNMISNSHETFYVNLIKSRQSVEPLANTYKVKSFEHFTEHKNQVEIREVIYLEDDTNEESEENPLN